MEWSDLGILLSARAFGERSEIVEVMTRAHGRAAGLVRGARSRRMRSVLLPGNGVRVRWRARLEEQLGAFDVELAEGRAGALMETSHAAFGLQWLVALLRLLPEREPNERLHDAAIHVLERLAAPEAAGEAVVRYELVFLEETGFGLDLTRCAATGTTADLAYVSPRSGRAVSREAGAPYAPRLLRLPAFLATGGGIDRRGLADGFELSGFFLERCVTTLLEKPMPAGRDRFVAAVLKATG